MLQARMRELFYDGTASLSTEVAQGEVDEYLNRAYQYTIPHDVGGEFSEQIYELQCELGQGVYSYPTQIVGLRTIAPWIESKLDHFDRDLVVDIGFRFLKVDTNPAVFSSKRQNASAPGYPWRLLFYGKQVTLPAWPDARYTIQIPVRSGPLVALTSTGIDHEIHALAVVSSACAEYLTTMKDTESVTEQAGNYARYRSQLQTYAQARPDTRRPARSF